MTTSLTPQAPVRVAALSFALPPALEAGSPPEARGLTRDAVRMMVAHRHDNTLVHAYFSDLPGFLEDGDLVVVNTSGTLAAELAATDPDGQTLAVHLSTQLPADLWTVELRREGQPYFLGHSGDELSLAGGGHLSLLTPYAAHGDGVRLWVASLALPEPLLAYLSAHGTPIRYGYVQGEWPISMYQNVYATEPGSAEMPSAGRPFTPEVLTPSARRSSGPSRRSSTSAARSVPAAVGPTPW